jgi:hypothetical protein
VISLKEGFRDLKVLSHFAVLPDGALEKRQQGSQGCGCRQHVQCLSYMVYHNLVSRDRRGVDRGSTCRAYYTRIS